MLDHHRPHAFREQRVSPALAHAASEAAVTAARARATRESGLEAYAVHRSLDGTRVMTVESWHDRDTYRADRDADLPGSALYAWAATGGTDPTPVDNPSAGVIVIDLFRVWRPTLGLVSAFNIRNGEAFNREPGCVSTTVLTGIGTGAIATYARWESADAFAAAFSKITGRHAASPDDVNRAAARMTLGLIRPDYHAYELVAYEGGTL